MYIFFFSLIVFTQATRYFLIILLIDASFLSSFHGPLLFPIWTRRSRTKNDIATFALVPSVFFWKIAATRRPPVGPRRATLLASFLRSHGGRKRYRAISSRNHERLLCPPPPPPFNSLLTFVLPIYVYLVAKNIRDVVKPLKSKNHNVFGTQASESFTSSDQSMDNQSMMTDSDNDNANDHPVSHLCTTSRASCFTRR